MRTFAYVFSTYVCTNIHTYLHTYVQYVQYVCTYVCMHYYHYMLTFPVATLSQKNLL